MVFDQWQIAKKIAGEDKYSDPDQATDRIEGEEAAVVHATHTSHKWGKGAHDRHEARDDDGLAAVGSVKDFR